MAITMGVLDRIATWRRSKVTSKDTVALIDLPSHNVTENRRIWDSYDWSTGGEEWTPDAKWKTTLINEMMLKYIVKGSTALEIGIGAGRWSEVLQQICGRVILSDISKQCLDICRERFKNVDNMEYHLIEENLSFISDNSIDFVWSYDVFVHINPSDIERYVSDFRRILKSGGYAIIHHSNMDLLQKNTDIKVLNKTTAFRSYMTAEIFLGLIEKYGMRMVEQNYTLPAPPTVDVISVFTKP